MTIHQRFRARLAVFLPLAVVGVVAAGLVDSPEHPARLRVSFLSLRAGTAIVLELPDGSAWLYDAGSLGSPESAIREISGFLWNRRIRRLDGVVISHADADHCNAIPDLVARFPTARICVSPGLLSTFDELAIELRETLSTGRAPLQVVEAGRCFTLSDGITFRVLHPDSNSLHGSRNANSIVLAINAYGRTILLPGDLERDGMESLLDQPAMDADVVLAPHHGSRYSFPSEFCAWCRPECVVISGGLPDRAHDVIARFQHTGAAVYHTALDGQVEVELSGSGVHVSTWTEKNDKEPFNNDRTEKEARVRGDSLGL